MENNELIQTDFALPLCRFICRENGEFVEKTTRDLFHQKRVVVFGLPGAFTPTCTTSQVPDYEAAYDDLIAAGVDEVYCVSVNDAFVMNAWRDSLGVKKVKFLPDGNGFFTRQLGMNVFKTNLGFGIRSWRYAMVISSETIEVLFAESGRGDNCEQDPYENSKPEKILSYLKEVPRTAFDPDENSIDSAQKLERLRNEILGGIKQE
jgi:peroxiredoxin